ncbi:MAG: dihydroxy-acid dehydratase [Dysosmobacter welbionis]
MEMVRRNICARDIINARSIRNALTCDMALGCSTNTVLHLLAIAQRRAARWTWPCSTRSARRPPTCATWPLRAPHAGPVRGRRHPCCPGGAGQARSSGSGLPDRHRQDRG